MSVLYADTSAIIGAYLADEPDHARLAGMLLGGDEAVVTSALARVEVAAALAAARRADRLDDPAPLLVRFDHDCSEGRRFTLLALRGTAVLESARRIVLQHSIGTLDAIHLAVAIEDAPITAGDEPVEFVTRDARQASAAAALGLTVRRA